MRTILNGLRQLLSPAAPVRSPPAPTRQPRRFRPRIEELERRLVPAGLVWQNAWQVSLGGYSGDGGSSSAAFGNVGAAGDEGSATAAASASAQAWGINGTPDDSPMYATFTGSVSFQRTFQVTGSATGWTVTLDGLLSGSLQSLGYAASASVTAGARIVQGTPDAAGSVTHDLDFGGYSTGYGERIVSVPGTRQGVIPDGTYTVIGYLQASATGYGDPIGPTIGDSNRAYSRFYTPPGLTVDVVLQDNRPAVSVRDAAFVEGNTGAVTRYFSVELSEPCAQTVTVDFSLADGSATLADSDYGYADASRTLTFAPGVTQQTIAVQIYGDRNPELNETFSVTLSNPTNVRIGDGQAVGTIQNDEPSISISDVAKKERRNGTTLFTFTVTLSAAYDQAVTMSFRTVDGTAQTSTADYVGKTGTLTFNPGETTKTITIEVNGDRTEEANETFYLDLFGNSTNSLFARNRGTGTILNDD